ncbi:MAG: biotin transporter BioY [Bacillota bacterium]|jgi:biotin transport system substrate-specific component
MGKNNKTRNLVLCALFAALIAVGAFIKIPVPPIPITLQVLFVTLAGLLLGKRLAAVAVAVYLVIGLAGVPVFAAGGGPGYIFQPTFGYLLGMLVGAYLTGLTVEKRNDYSFKTMFLASLVNLAAIYGIGLLYFWLVANYYVGSQLAVSAWLMTGLIMTIPGDLLCNLLASKLAQRLFPVINKKMKSKLR